MTLLPLEICPPAVTSTSFPPLLLVARLLPLLGVPGGEHLCPVTVIDPGRWKPGIRSGTVLLPTALKELTG